MRFSCVAPIPRRIAAQSRPDRIRITAYGARLTGRSRGYEIEVQVESHSESEVPSLVAVVNDATTEIGRACARRFARAGSMSRCSPRKVSIWPTPSPRSKRTVGGRAGFEVDRSGNRAFDAVVGHIESRFGPIEVWVNVPPPAEPVATDRLDADQLTRETMHAYLWQVTGTVAALRRMRGRNRGVVVSVGSVRSFRPAPGQAPSTGAQFRGAGLPRSCPHRAPARTVGGADAQVHLGGTGAPPAAGRGERAGTGATRSPDPERAAAVIVAAAERPRRQRIVGIGTWAIVQANKFAPGLLDHMTALWAPPRVRAHRARHRWAGGGGDPVPRPLLRTVERSLVDATHAVSCRAREIVSDWGP